MQAGRLPRRDLPGTRDPFKPYGAFEATSATDREAPLPQAGRLPDDHTAWNDQDTNSHKWTWNDTNHRQNAGLS
ncbi:hypothetical protein TPCV2_01010 [Cutibacterium avidum]|nr:hypothetical protein TPCV4_09220 [Cutibacterium avidum]